MTMDKHRHLLAQHNFQLQLINHTAQFLLLMVPTNCKVALKIITSNFKVLMFCNLAMCLQFLLILTQ